MSEQKVTSSYKRLNNARIGWLMTQIERNQDETALEPYMQGYLSELEVRVRDARADYGCDGSHAFHSTACHACYVIRKVEDRRSAGDYVPLWLRAATDGVAC